MSTRMQNGRYFITEFGEKISIISGYSRINRILTGQFVKKLKPTGLPAKVNINIKNPDNCFKDFLTYAHLVDLLEEAGLLPEVGYEKALDIGGAEGIHAALFRSEHAKQIFSIDYMDGSDPKFKEKMKQIVFNHKQTKFKKYDLVRNKIFRYLSKIYKIKGQCANSFFAIPSERHLYDFKFKRELDVDKFIKGCFLKEINEKFDIVLSFLTLSVMDYKKCMKKIKSILEPGGIFVFFTRYLWGPGVEYLDGDFPYFYKRLTLNDQKNYYKIWKPQQAQYVEDVYNYHPYRPTVNDYIEAANENGLSLVTYKRLKYPFLTDYSKYYHESNPVITDHGSMQILRDIKHFNNDITMDDLMTAYIMMIFKD